MTEAKDELSTALVIADDPNVTRCLQAFDYKMISVEDMAKHIGFTPDQLKMLKLFWDPSFNKSWMYLSPEFITKDMGYASVGNFYTKLKEDYAERTQYMKVNRNHPLVKKFYLIPDPLRPVPGNRADFYIISSKALREMLMCAMTPEGKKIRGHYLGIDDLGIFMKDYMMALQTHCSRLEKEATGRLMATQTLMIEDANVKIAVEQKRIEDLRVQAEVDRLRAEDEKKALTLKHETEQKEKDEQLAIQREALRLKHDTCKKWEEKAINRDPPPKIHLMYLASTAQYMVENLWKVGGVECEAALPGRLNLYQSGHSESDPFYYAWRMPCHNFRAIEDEFWTINGRYRDKQGTKKEMIRMHRDDILRDLNRIMSRTELTINECVAEYPATMKRAIEEEGQVYPNLDEPKVKKIPKINIAATAEIDTVKKELVKHIATRYPNYVFETDKNTTAITIEWKVIAPSFDVYTNTRTHWCKMTKSTLDGTKIIFIPRGAAPTP
jgi:hypothetical protein